MGSVTFDGMVIFCSDVEASARFYEGALGLARHPGSDDVTMRLPTRGNPEGAWLLLHPRHGDTTPPYPIGSFAVDDVDEVVGRLRAAGYRVSSEPTDQPWGVREAGVLDPDGYGLTLASALPARR